MARPWRVQLHEDAASWAESLLATDPAAAKWLMAAFRMLEQRGSALLTSVPRAGCQSADGSEPGWDSGGKTLVIDCYLLLNSEVTYVRQCALIGQAQTVTAVIVRCRQPSPPDNLKGHGKELLLHRTASRLLGVAAQLLPIRYRSRYAEEFRAELWDLAAAGVPRWHQVAYSVRLLQRAISLRLALRAETTRSKQLARASAGRHPLSSPGENT